MNFGMFTDFHVRQNMSQAEAFDESFRQVALVQLNGDIFLFYNKSLGDLNVEKFTH